MGVVIVGTSSGMSSTLFTAVHRDDCALAESLLDEGADINETDADGLTPLHHVRSAEMVDVLVNQMRPMHPIMGINTLSREGETPYMRALKKSRVNVMRKLYSKGAHIGTVRGSRDSSLLTHAGGYDAAWQLLLHSHLEMQNHVKAFHSIRNYGVIRAALEYGIPVNVQDSEGNTALHREAFRAKKNTVYLLLRHGASDTIWNKRELVPHEHCWKGFGIERPLRRTFAESVKNFTELVTKNRVMLLGKVFETVCGSRQEPLASLCISRLQDGNLLTKSEMAVLKLLEIGIPKSQSLKRRGHGTIAYKRMRHE